MMILVLLTEDQHPQVVLQGELLQNHQVHHVHIQGVPHSPHNLHLHLQEGVLHNLHNLRQGLHRTVRIGKITIYDKYHEARCKYLHLRKTCLCGQGKDIGEIKMPDESEDARDCKRCRTLIVFGGDAVPRHRPDDLITAPTVAQLHPITWISSGARHSQPIVRNRKLL